jgi:hypothetical protein
MEKERGIDNWREGGKDRWMQTDGWRGEGRNSRQIEGRMKGWGGWEEGWSEGGMDGGMDRGMDGGIDVEMKRWMDRGWTEGWTE